MLFNKMLYNIRNARKNASILQLAGTWRLLSNPFTMLVVSPITLLYVFIRYIGSRAPTSRSHTSSLPVDDCVLPSLFNLADTSPIPSYSINWIGNLLPHNFLFSLTPFWKCDVTKWFSFSISYNNVTFSRSLHFGFLTLFEANSPCANIFLFPVKADDNYPEGSGVVTAHVVRNIGNTLYSLNSVLLQTSGQ